MCNLGKSETIVSTFGPGDEYQDCCGFGNVAPYQLAYSFTIPSGGPNFIFESASLALSDGLGTAKDVDISLATDASNQPGTVLETFSLLDVLGPSGTDNPLIVVDSVLDPLLLAGEQYWLIETPPTPGNGVIWQSGYITPNSSERAISAGDGSWTVESVDPAGAFSVSGIAVPEPGSTAFLAASILAAWIVRRKFQETGRQRSHKN